MDFPDFLCGLETVHNWHVAVHKYQLIVMSSIRATAHVLLVLMVSIIDHVKSFLSVHGFIRLHIVRKLQDCLQSHNVKDVIIDNKYIISVLAWTGQ
jgi:hypothetical protein